MVDTPRGPLEILSKHTSLTHCPPLRIPPQWPTCSPRIDRIIVQQQFRSQISQKQNPNDGIPGKTPTSKWYNDTLTHPSGQVGPRLAVPCLPAAKARAPLPDVAPPAGACTGELALSAPPSTTWTPAPGTRSPWS